MRIMIEYESTWRNSFLDGNNNEPLPKGGRKFVAAGKNINGMQSKSENFIRREITHDTVMGILNRIIGDQRKLYQSRLAKDYLFHDIENRIKFDDTPTITNEVTYIRNVTGSTDQQSFTGAIKNNDPIFSSDYSSEFWGVLALDIEELYDFVVSDLPIAKAVELNPFAIIYALEKIKKEKPVPREGHAFKLAEYLLKHFSSHEWLDNKGNVKMKPFNKKGEVLLLPLYCSSLYLQLERLAVRFDMSSAKAARGGITGISHNGFTVKNIMDRFTTGGQKKIWGNPYMRKERIKGEGEVVSLMTKASGTLEITIDVDRDRAKEIKLLIENAGVSSFYLGKKGLAYVADIDTREVKR